MKRYFKFIFIAFILLEYTYAKNIIDCRVATSVITECNPYGKRLHHIKEVVYEKDRKKLIIVKTLPVPKKKNYLKVISVADMIEKYIKIDESVRFKGSNTLPEQQNISLVLTNETSHHVKSSTFGTYIVRKGDALSKIAKKLGLKQSEIKKNNDIKNSALLRIGQKLKIPLEQKMIDALSYAKYTVEEGDTLLSIAKKFKLPAKDIVSLNRIKDATTVRQGKVLKLPLPYVMDRLNEKERQADSIGSGSNLDINAFGTHKLRVTATAYTSHSNQTDDTPFLAAWNNRLKPGMKIIAVSRDLLTKYGMRNGTKLRISGTRGYYRVRDKMNKRYKKRIDIYMGLNLRKALKWGRRSVVIYW